MRLIDADELKGKAIADPDDGKCFVYCQDIDEAPTVDAVPVVRCRECKFYFPGSTKPCVLSIGLTMVDENDFCSYGERNENENHT